MGERGDSWRWSWWRRGEGYQGRFSEPPPVAGEAPEAAEPAVDAATALREWAEFAEHLATAQPLLVQLIVVERHQYERQLELARNPPPPPAREAPEPEAEPQQGYAVATTEDVARLLDVAHPLLRVVIRLQLASDLSREEVRLLRWDGIDEAAGTVRLDKGRRQANLTVGMRAELARIGRHPNSPYVLPRVFGDADPVWRNDIEQLWCDARRDAGALWRRLPRPRDQEKGPPPPAVTSEEAGAP